MRDKGELRLYVTGSTLLSTRAIENVEQFMREELGEIYACEVIDVLERPDLAAQDGIFATPALVRRSPRRGRKLIGDLTVALLVMRTTTGPGPGEEPFGTADRVLSELEGDLLFEPTL